MRDDGTDAGGPASVSQPPSIGMALDGVRAVLDEDLDIPGKRARTRSKNGDVDWLFFG